MSVLDPSRVPKDGSPTVGNAGVSVLPLPAAKSVASALYFPSVEPKQELPSELSMYPGPASGVTPILTPWPPSGQVIGAATGEPLMPSPTSGSSPASMIPIFAGQPLRKAEEVQWALAQLKPPVAQEDGS